MTGRPRHLKHVLESAREAVAAQNLADVAAAERAIAKAREQQEAPAGERNTQ